MTRRARVRITIAATLLALVAPTAVASAESLCTRVWVGPVNERVCVPVP